MYLSLVAFCDILFDIVSFVLLSKTCRYDFGRVLGYHPFSPTLKYAFIASMSVVWAPCALGCFGWVFQHMCVAAFESNC